MDPMNKDVNISVVGGCLIVDFSKKATHTLISLETNQLTREMTVIANQFQYDDSMDIAKRGKKLTGRMSDLWYHFNVLCEDIDHNIHDISRYDIKTKTTGFWWTQKVHRYINSSSIKLLDEKRTTYATTNYILIK
jgi:hypothetical protein